MSLESSLTTYCQMRTCEQGNKCMPRHATSDTRAAQARKPSEVAYLCWDGARDAVLGDIPVTPFFCWFGSYTLIGISLLTQAQAFLQKKNACLGLAHQRRGAHNCTSPLRLPISVGIDPEMPFSCSDLQKHLTHGIAKVSAHQTSSYQAGQDQHSQMRDRSVCSQQNRPSEQTRTTWTVCGAC